VENQPTLFVVGEASCDEDAPSTRARNQLVTLSSMTVETLLKDLDDARRRKGLSKSDLADMAGTHSSAVRRLFTNEDRIPNLATVAAIAEALGQEMRLVPRSSTQPQEDDDVRESLRMLSDTPFSTVLADPPWRFMNRTGKVAPEHRRLSRYDTMTTSEIAALPVAAVTSARSHLYLWVPNALIADGLAVMEAWGFTYKANLVWAKRRKDGGPDGRGVGFYFRNVTELLLFGVRGSMRTLDAGRRQVNMIETRKREHSRKPDEQYELIEACSPGPFLEMFARYPREGWSVWGNEADDAIVPRGRQYAAYK
jgi:N6-adenosine-specific RNA methylase IME4/DNA-binding phage protein